MPEEHGTGTSSGTDVPYGPGVNADETRQAQHQFTNDMPTYMNPNASVTESRDLTVNALGKGFVANQERRQILADKVLGLKIE